MRKIEFSLGGKKVGEFPLFIWRYENMYLMRLAGIDINPHTAGIVPVYNQAFSIVQHPGQLALSVFLFRKANVFTFQARAPWVSFAVYKAMISQEISEDAE